MVLLPKNRRIILRVCLMTAILIGIAALVYQIVFPKTKNEEVVLYRCTFNQQMNYAVHLVENDIYSDTSLPEDSVYISKLLDYIDVNFQMLYQVDHQADIQLEYEIAAKVVGYTANNNSRAEYWSKEFPIEEKKVEQITSNSLQKEQDISFKLKEYEDFAKHANDTTGLNLSSDLVVSLTGNIAAQTPKGLLETPIDMQLIIPLLDNAFSITKGQLQSGSDQITEPKETTLPPDKGKITLISIAAAIGILAFVLSFFLLIEPLEQDYIQKEIMKIIKNYGSRMIALYEKPRKKFEYQYRVTHINDLLILADEIQKPIYYIKEEDTIAEDQTFYVEADHELYYYKVESGISHYMDRNYLDYLDEIAE
jgi:hypothetical protein